MCLLTEADPGSKYTVASVYERDRKLLEFFEQEGIRPGVRLVVESRNYDGTVSLIGGQAPDSPRRSGGGKDLAC